MTMGELVETTTEKLEPGDYEVLTELLFMVFIAAWQMLFAASWLFSPVFSEQCKAPIVAGIYFLCAFQVFRFNKYYANETSSQIQAISKLIYGICCDDSVSFLWFGYVWGRW